MVKKSPPHHHRSLRPRLLLWPLAILMLLVLLLRFPTLFEPFWYADEGIYLSVGQALRSGWKLYSGIFDHKTPLIYWLASFWGANLITWRALGMILALASTVFFYLIVQKLTTPRHWPAISATFLFILLTNLPLLEGNVINGEIFFMTFGLAGIYFWLQTKIWDSPAVAPAQFGWAFASGLAFGLSFITKFHGLADLVAIALPTLFLSPTDLKKNRSALLGLASGFATILFLTLAYFLINHNLSAFWDRAFLFSFNYSEYQQVGHNFITQALFTTTGKFYTLLTTIALLWTCRYRLSRPEIFALWWLVLTIVTATLSNRAYPHYFLQIVPAFCLTTILLFTQLAQFFHSTNNFFSSLRRTFLAPTLIILSLGYLCFSIYIIDPTIIRPTDQTRQTIPYYLNFSRYLFGQQNNYAFYQFFDQQLKDNYAIADIIRTQSQNNQLLIWGNNPQLYALTKTLPLTSFLTNYHAYDDYFDDQTATILDLSQAWHNHQPTFVVWMANYQPWGERAQADQNFLQNELHSHYNLIYTGNNLALWQKKDYDQQS